MITFESVARLYIGCHLITSKGVYKVSEVNMKYVPVGPILETNIEMDENYCKPILKRLVNLTKEDADHLGWAWPDVTEHYSFYHIELADFSAIDFLYLLKKGYDLFGLIDNGEAIEQINS